MSKGIEWDRIRRLIQEVVESQGYDLVDAEFKGAGKSSFLRVFIDKPAGISHHDCEVVREQVGTAVGVQELNPFSYRVGVSSPLLDPELCKKRDYSRIGEEL